MCVRTSLTTVLKINIVPLIEVTAEIPHGPLLQMREGLTGLLSCISLLCSGESQGQGLRGGVALRQSICCIVTHSTTTTEVQKREKVQKTSVGLHSRGAISAISVGITAALPAGSPSGGVSRCCSRHHRDRCSVGGGGERGGGCFSPLRLLLGNVGQEEEQKMLDEH